MEFCPRDATELPILVAVTQAELAAGLTRRYRIVRRLGVGGMGTVFLAEQIELGNRPVAVKVLRRQLLDDPEFLWRFQNEASSTARIHHRNVVTIYESGQTDDGSPYIAMEYLEGESLREALRSRGALARAAAAEILQQAARGLNAAHKMGIIHRDLKPDNIFLTRDDEVQMLVKIVDFGIAKMREPSTQTVTGLLMGTPAYMSFEQAAGMRSDELDARSDIYSLGIVAYEMLTGKVPFHADTSLACLQKHLTEEPPPLRLVRPDLRIPPQLEQVVMKALAKERDERYSSAPEFAREFGAAVALQPEAELSSTSLPSAHLDTEDVRLLQRLAEEGAEQERLACEKAEAERLVTEKPEAEPVAHEDAERQPGEAGRLAAEEADREQAVGERVEPQRLAAQRLEADRATPKIQEPIETEATAEKERREKPEREPAARERTEREGQAARGSEPEGFRPIPADEIIGSSPRLDDSGRPPSPELLPPAVSLRGLYVLLGSLVLIGSLMVVIVLIHGRLGPKAKGVPPSVPSYLALPSGNMVLVPGGEARQGADRHEVRIESFYIDKTEVTSQAYLAFCRETGRPKPPKAAHADYPVVNVTFDDAQAFCRWAGKRLPRANEWEKAARGVKGQAYPWGDTLDYELANIPRDKNVTKLATLAPAAAYGSGASPYGALNMLGNVWEWVNTPAPALDEVDFGKLKAELGSLTPPLSRTDPLYQVRGGSYQYLVPADQVRALLWDDTPMPARAHEPDVGFRCARDVR
jgi:formylglycine-generating enzyme required for sulfatase activity/tRNA A-37 threonylcarbamoyl transferase component Bud32